MFTFRLALQHTLVGPRHVAAWLGLALSVFLLLVLVPVWMTPGNDVAFQLSIMPPEVLALAIVLSLGNALLLMMQLRIARTQRAVRGSDVAAQGGLLVGAIMATISCVACYSSLASVVGLAGVAFLAEHRVWIMVFAVALLGTALHFTSRRVAGICTRCDRFRPH